ncbi:MFS transporter [Luteococcus sediminum]
MSTTVRATTDRQDGEVPGSTAVLTLSTIAFTVMFAVWLMFGILGKPIQKEFGLTDVQLSWISAVAILNGSIWRLPAGMITDRVGGRKVISVILAFSAIASFAVAFANSYHMLLVLAFLVGFAGNSFSVGVAWNSAWFSNRRKGFALGLFGAGNVGASVTKFIGPPLIAGTAGMTWFGVVQGGWRLIPVIYSALLVLLLVLVLVGTPREDRMPGATKTTAEMLEPLKELRVWRFSLYYVAVFGAYVALSAWLPKYYMDNFGISLTRAGLLTALFIFPASLLRPVGGWFSDTFGPRKAMYLTFTVMLIASGLLSLPNFLGVVSFTVVVFALGCAMGIGKAAVYKHIPDYFPDNVGSVGGLVGMLGGLGGFFLPPLFAYAQQWTGAPTSTFVVLFVLILVCMLWMHLTIHAMLQNQTPHLSEHFENPTSTKETP